MKYDVFISHASEDKVSVASPLAEYLKALGLQVWIDSTEIRLGDSLRRSIDAGLANSRYGLAIISPAFLRKEWPQKELDGLFAREYNGTKVVIPVWHNLSHTEISKISPLLADKKAISTSEGLPTVAKEIHRAITEYGGVANHALPKVTLGALKTLEQSGIKNFIAAISLAMLYISNPGEASHEQYIAASNKNGSALTPVYRNFFLFSVTYDNPNLECKNGYTINLDYKQGGKFIGCTDKNDGRYDYAKSRVLTYGLLWKVYSTEFLNIKLTP